VPFQIFIFTTVFDQSLLPENLSKLCAVYDVCGKSVGAWYKETGNGYGAVFAGAGKQHVAERGEYADSICVVFLFTAAVFNKEQVLPLHGKGAAELPFGSKKRFRVFFQDAGKDNRS
jgi:hypothetical protein